MPKLAPSRHKLEIIAAIEQCKSHVTVGDVATATGLDVWLVEQALMSLAVDAEGHLQVTQDGSIAYVFPRNFKAILIGRTGWARLQNLMRKAGAIMWYLLRVSFGILLIILTIANALALAVVIVLLIVTSDSNGDHVDVSSLFDLFRFDPFFRFHPQPFHSGEHRLEPVSQRRAIPAKAKLNFSEAIYSILFGDGNPNADLEEKRWRLIASLIRHQSGVIIAEQLFPFLDQKAGAAESEDDVLPALVRFNGRPHVSPAGDLVYSFPDLQLTAQPTQGESEFATMPSAEQAPFLEELPWRFSLASKAQKIGAGVLATLLLLVSLSLAHTVSLVPAGVVVWRALLAGMATAGIGYSCSLLLLPIIRYAWLSLHNAGLAKRNASRRKRSEVLHRWPSRVITRKLAYAQHFAEQRLVDTSRLAYTSEKGLIEQELANDREVAADWHQRLNDTSSYKL